MESLMEFLVSIANKPVWFGLGIISALLGIYQAGVIARRRSAADVVFQSRKDDGIRDGFQKARDLHDSDEKNIRKFAKPGDRQSKESRALNYVLNHFEYVSVGIQRKIYDEKLLKRSNYTTVVKLYDRTKPYIDEIRIQEGRKTIYQEFEWLACRWKRSPLKAKKIKVNVN